MSTTIQLCLLSHTNVGKTTLARTLLAEDIGEVQDAAHITETASGHTLITTDQGHSLQIWDTPGFGDSARLAARLEQSESALGWFLTEVWDRVRDRPFWLSQRALVAARDHADIVLYLVNAAESPRDIGYLDAEMRILKWLGKPVLVLLNQMGPPKPATQEINEAQQWARALQPYSHVRDIIPLDAFARCWVHESVLLHAIEHHLDASLQPAFRVLRQSWEARNQQRFEASMDVLASFLLQASQASVDLEKPSLWQSARGSLASQRTELSPEKEAAVRELEAALSDSIQQASLALLKLHKLDGKLTVQLDQRLHENFAFDTPMDIQKVGFLGAIASGAVTGATADLMSGGLTLGGGLLVGAVVGGLTFAGGAMGMNKLSGKEKPTAQLDPIYLEALTVSVVLRYLAVAHFGRGRGNYVEGESPAFWKEYVAHAIETRRAGFLLAWQAARRHDGDALLTLRQLLLDATASVLNTLYPNAITPVDASPKHDSQAEPTPEALPPYHAGL